MALCFEIQDHAIDEILRLLPVKSERDVYVTCNYCPGQPLTLYKRGNKATIEYGRRVELFRGLGLLAEHIEEDEYARTQKPCFTTDGVMLDCSRNGVPKVSTIKRFIRIMALMGLDMLMLYTEDTYEIPEYPYFGYMRGRYSTEELQEIDRYADAFGVELVPCIQTLAHLQGMFRWPCFEEVHDCTDVLLCEEEKTYELIDAMLRSCRNAFKSDRIHIGMDEAFMMGFGKYRFSRDTVDREKMFCNHIERVKQICETYNFKPMIWSDMFFRIAFQGAYASDREISSEVTEMLTKDVELVYWEYEKLEKEDYITAIVQHQKFSNPLMFAGGAWRWTGFTPSLEYSLNASCAALEACKEKKVKDILLTAWGDNGNEASFFTILPVMQLYAEMNYADAVSKEELTKRLFTCTGELLDDMLLLDLPNRPDGRKHGPAANPSKYIFYQDVLGGLMEKHMEDNYPEYYAKTAVLLREAAERSKEYGYMYQMLSELCSVLEIKSMAGVRAQTCYLTDDREGLRKIAYDVLPTLLSRMQDFHKAVEKQWNIENKVFGYEVLDLRIGGVESRVTTAISRLKRYLEGELLELEELQEERLYFDCRKEEQETKVVSYNLWMPVSSANLI